MDWKKIQWQNLSFMTLKKTFLQENVVTTRHFESPSVGLALIFFSSSSCTPNMPTMKWNVV